LLGAKYYGQSMTMDAQGRALIPAPLRKTEQIKGEADTLDYLNYLEVWNHTRFAKNMNCKPVTAQDELLLESLAKYDFFPNWKYTQSLSSSRCCYFSFV